MRNGGESSRLREELNELALRLDLDIELPHVVFGAAEHFAVDVNDEWRFPLDAQSAATADVDARVVWWRAKQREPRQES